MIKLGMTMLTVLVGIHAWTDATGAEPESESVEVLLSSARAAIESGQFEEAQEKARRATKIAPHDAAAWHTLGKAAEFGRQFDTAVEAYSRLTDLKPEEPAVWHRLGAAAFKAARPKESVEAFDKELALAPTRKPDHWQRGISLYYAGMFQEGRRQFELHRTVNPHDVENAVWHYLCVAELEGTENAREVLIPVTGDNRVPMAEVHELFAGRGAAEEVLRACKESGAEGVRGANETFYAHLYLGLYHEAQGDRERARDHLLKAVREYAQDHYMGDVARVHVKLRGYHERAGQ